MIGNTGIEGSKGPGNVPVTTWGAASVDTADSALGQVVWPVHAVVQNYIFIDTAIQLFVVSDSANDTSAGTGARTLSLMFDDASGVTDTTEITMLGTTQVPLPSLSFGVFIFETETSGSLNTNEGNIRVVDGSANVYAIIEPGTGRSQIAVLRCPNDKKGEIRKHVVSFSKPSGQSDSVILLNKRKIDGTIVTLWAANLSAVHTEDSKEYVSDELPFEAGEFLYWDCTEVSANGTPIKAYFDIEFEDLDI